MDIVFAMLYTEIQMLHYSESVPTIRSNIFENKLFVNFICFFFVLIKLSY